MGYEIRNNIDKGYFRFNKVNSSNESIESILDKHKVDINNYWIIKATRRFKLIDIEQINKPATIICFSKNLYSKEYIEDFFEFLIKIDLTSSYLVKPIPPKQVLNKIKIIK